MGTQTVELVLRWLMVFLVYEGFASGRVRAEVRAAGPVLTNESVAVHLPQSRPKGT